jgi:AmmeMemoRadiSam system protein A
MIDEYTPGEQVQLLEIAHRTLEVVASGKPRPALDMGNMPTRLCQERACFVTFHIDGDLRGCTGTLAARRPLAEEVGITTVQTAFDDPRFPPVSAAEVPFIQIELSILTPSVPLPFESPDDLLHLLRPGIDGVTLRLGVYRSTFLPQVWERVPNPAEFLALLSRKMGLPGDAWRRPGMMVETYQTVTIEDAE